MDARTLDKTGRTETGRRPHGDSYQPGIPKGGLYICYTHPKASIEQFRAVDNRRKPGPGMLLEAMRDFEASPEETLYVGDLPEDEEAAKNAGCQFIWAGKFFSEEGHANP